MEHVSHLNAVLTIGTQKVRLKIVFQYIPVFDCHCLFNIRELQNLATSCENVAIMHSENGVACMCVIANVWMSAKTEFQILKNFEICFPS